ncbi:MAG: type I methionyl aminopeptidase [Thermincola sp.]|nr:type I methionyl aminopeptidase [Thermincola sp.]MDT3701619.1 type I methionyl aminopeptidase [Thermincola sp.]
MIQIKSKEEIELMRQSNQIVARLLQKLSQMVAPGITTAQLDEFAEKFIRQHGAIPTFKGYAGYPACICTSVNNQVVHAIPGPQVLKNGDIISIDAGAKLNGFCGDATITVGVGTISKEARRLIDITAKALEIGISQATPGNRIGDIGYAVQHYVEGQGCSVVRDFVGHGIGREMHEDPQVPHFGRPGTGPILREGMVIAIEPMINAGGYKLKILPDGWTAVTVDGSLSAQFEHSVAITANGPDVLSRL